LALVFAVSACGSSSSSGGGSSSAAAGATSTGSSSGAASAAASKSPFNVLTVVDTSGPTKLYGDIQLAGMKGAVAYVNKTGGILGHPVKLAVINDNGAPTTAASQFLKYMSGGNPTPNMVFPGTSANDSAALLPLLKRYHTLAIGTVLGGGCRTKAQSICPTGFLPDAGYEGALPAVAEFLKKKGLTHVGILLQQGPLAADQLGVLLPALKAQGVKYSLVQFPPTAVDVTPQMSELKSDGVQAIYGDAFIPAPAYIAKARDSLGLVQKLPLIFGPVASASDLTTQMSAAVLKNAFEDTYAVNLPSQKFAGRDPMIQYAKPYGGITAQPVNLGAYPWTDLILAREAAQQANSISANPMIAALNHLSQKAQTDPLYTLSTHLLFTPDNHENAAPNQEAMHPVVPVAPLVNGMLASG
jgi:branched-chain amino acid transport system substrate-binding protein